MSDGTEWVEFDLFVPPELRWFEGHFPGEPILAAVVQVREAVYLVGRNWPALPGLARIKRAKFRKPIRPRDELTLKLTRRGGASLVTFEYARDGEACSGGSLEFD